MFIGTYFENLYMMNGGGEVPLFALVGIGMSFAFLVAKILLTWVKISKSVAYGLAGSAAILAIVLLMPLAFYNLDILAGADLSLVNQCFPFMALLVDTFLERALAARLNHEQKIKYFRIYNFIVFAC